MRFGVMSVGRGREFMGLLHAINR